MQEIKTFPFGQPIVSLAQSDRSPKRVFILGVYASAVHARWVGEDGRSIVRALAVASEPEIFWRGEGEDDIIANIPVPLGAGKLLPAGKNLNGPSGKALDKMFLDPLQLKRSDVWLCDLVPYSCMNDRQKAALASKYDEQQEKLSLTDYYWPPVPPILANEQRRAEIAGEVSVASPDIFITLGDQPLRWFTKYFGSKSKLSEYGESTKQYGLLHDISITGRDMKLLPLAHPRQAGKLGSHSVKWANLHESWMKDVARNLL